VIRQWNQPVEEEAMDTSENSGTSVDTMVDEFQAGKISRRELVAGIGAAAVGGFFTSVLLGGTSVSAQAPTPTQLDRARVLLSRIANLRITIDPAKFNLLPTEGDPLVFDTGDAHQGWLFNPVDGLLTGDAAKAATAVTKNLGATAGAGAHNGATTNATEAAPIGSAHTNCDAMKLFTMDGQSTPMRWLSRVFDLKLGICEVEGMFHLAKEIHQCAQVNCSICEPALYDHIITRLTEHYKTYFPNATSDDVKAKLAATRRHDIGDLSFNSHVW
jgi:hypothetical protein